VRTFTAAEIDAAILRAMEDNLYMRDWEGDEGISFLYGYTCAELGRGAGKLAGLREHVRACVLNWRAAPRGGAK
jgi:hypothetical protein